MLKFTHRLTAVLLAVFCLVPLFSITASAASQENDGDQALYVEKYVSVLYDNSGSMINSSNNKYDNRAFYANYAFQMLASMMNNSDKLWATPMNVSALKTATVSDAKLFTFTNNRDNDIKTFVSKYLDPGKPLAPISSAGTPISSIAVARERLFKTDDINGYVENEERKHWLVIMTDGIFTENGDLPVERAVQEMVRELDENPSMNIIYLGMGAAADLGKAKYTDKVNGKEVEKDNPLYSDYAGRFYGFKADAATVVDSMRDVINLMSDRYTLDEKALTPEQMKDFITLSDDKKTATVKLSYLPFPLQSISYAVQNFGGKLTKATYSGRTFTPENCEIIPPSELKMQGGATGIIRDSGANPFLFNTSDASSELVLYFDKPVEKENIALMAEPSLYIVPYFEYKPEGEWIEATEVEIMKRAKVGDKIKVGYRVYNGATGLPLSDKVLGPEDKNATLYVNNTLFQKNLTGTSDEITLKVDSNPIRLNVTLMDVYHLEKNVDIRIIGSTAGYSMTATHTPADNTAPHKTTSVFTPKKDNSPMSVTELSEYTATVKVTNMEGKEVATGAKAQLRDDGTYLVELDLSAHDFGEYMLELTLSHNFYPINISEKTLPQYYPASVSIGFDGESEITKTQNGFDRGQDRAITFTLSADGKAFDFDNGLLSYELKFAGVVIKKDYYTVSGNKLKFTPDKDTVGALLGKDPAEYPITLSVSSKEHPHLKDTKTAKLILTETKLEVVLVKNDMLPIDRFDIQDTPAEVIFAVNCDYEYLTADELLIALGEKEKDAENPLHATIGRLTIESDWCDNILYPVDLSDPEIVEMTLDGSQVACVKVAIEPGHFGFLREHFTAWLIPKGDKPIVARYENASASAELETAFVLATSDAWSYIWRLLVILLWLHIIIAILVNPSVPRHAKGHFIILSIGITDSGRPRPDVDAVNITFKDRAIPGRWFIPFRPIKSQKDKGNRYITFSHTHRDKNADRKAPVDKTVSKAVFQRAAVIFDRNNLTEFSNFMDNCNQATPTRASITAALPRDFTNGMLRNMFKARIEHNDTTAASNYIPKGSVDTNFSSQHVYGFYTGGREGLDKLDTLVFFIPR